MTEIVMFVDGEAKYHLSNVKYDEEGNFKSGFVKNGCWKLSAKNGEFLAKDGNYIVNRWPVPNYEIIEVPEKLKGDYNHVMSKMRKMYKS